METLWAPWRMEYILGNKAEGCVFCRAAEDGDGLTLYTGKRVLVVMNKFPYTNGHLLVSPIRHLASLEELTFGEMGDLMGTVAGAVAILKKTMAPEGFNVGLNLGKAAGAGVADHLHVHIVPRWQGDVNAMTVLADVRVIPEHIQTTFDRLKPHFDQLNLSGSSGETV